MKWLYGIMLAALSILSIIGAASALSSIDIRGPMATIEDGKPYAIGQDQLSGDFSGFYYDIDDDLGTESLTLNFNGERLDGDSTPRGARYRTDAEDCSFQFKDWGWYRLIGFVGDAYFAGYSSQEYSGDQPYLYKISEDDSLLDDGVLLKVLMDDDEERMISSSRPLKLQEGYELRLKSVDIDGDKAYLELYKDGSLADEKVVMPSLQDASMAEKTYYFNKSFEDQGDSGRNIVIIGVHFKNAYRSSEGDAATVNGVFQVSDQPLRIRTNNQYGNMTVTEVTQDSIIIENADRTISLNKNQNIPLMMDIFIKTADQDFTELDPLRFYIYRKITEPGIHEVRGKAAEVVDGRTTTWDAENFPGFFYDLDENLGSEEISITTSSGEGSGQAYPGEIVYKTRAQEMSLKEDIWGKYYSLGFMGENYFAGYVEDSADSARSLLWSSSDDRNLMAGEILCKVLIDNDDELMPFAAGSVVGLEEGYALLIKGVDVDGKKVHVALRKDNSDLDEKVIVLDEDMGTYLFRAPIGSGDRNKIVTIAVHFKNAYHATEADMATVDGIWQISDRPLSIRDGLDFDEMAIKRIDSKEGEMAIEMSNDDAIGLRGGKKIKLMGDFYIKTSDQDEVDQSKPLRYYIFREIEIDEGAKEKEDANSEVEVAPASAETSKPYGEEKKTVPGFQGIIALLSLAAVFLAGRRR
jgi:S-layer protein (TIGR01567 family)